jgi:hypothetical protein
MSRSLAINVISEKASAAHLSVIPEKASAAHPGPSGDFAGSWQSVGLEEPLGPGSPFGRSLTASGMTCEGVGR